MRHSYHSETTFYSTELWKSREKTLKKLISAISSFLRTRVARSLCENCFRSMNAEIRARKCPLEDAAMLR